jgi:hypothetical protein
MSDETRDQDGKMTRKGSQTGFATTHRLDNDGWTMSKKWNPFRLVTQFRLSNLNRRLSNSSIARKGPQKLNSRSSGESAMAGSHHRDHLQLKCEAALLAAAYFQQNGKIHEHHLQTAIIHGALRLMYKAGMGEYPFPPRVFRKQEIEKKTNRNGKENNAPWTWDNSIF